MRVELSVSPEDSGEERILFDQCVLLVGLSNSYK